MAVMIIILFICLIIMINYKLHGNPLAAKIIPNQCDTLKLFFFY